MNDYGLTANEPSGVIILQIRSKRFVLHLINSIGA